MRDHNKLRAFELADALVVAVYSATRSFPKDEQFGLTSQIRRSAVSAASNIVEGCARASESDYRRFLDIAFGSARELRYQLSIAARLGYIAADASPELARQAEETERVLGALVQSMRTAH
jgi:four helix bundle protein